MYSVGCRPCGEVAKVPDDDKAPAAIAATLMATHAQKPHHQHTLYFSPMPHAGKKVVITCLRCEGQQMTDRVPPELVPAMVIVFHSAHEGHALEVNYNDGEHVWRSPETK